MTSTGRKYIKYLPNVVTLGRIVLVPFMVMAIVNYEYQMALIYVLIMGASDALDGFLAKVCDAQSRLGERLDPLADKLMLVSALVALTIAGLIPLWLTVLVVARDIVLLVGSAIQCLKVTGLSVRPIWVSKLSTLLQIILVSCVLANQLWPVFEHIITATIYLTALTIVVSSYMYLRLFMTSGLNSTGSGGNKNRLVHRTHKIT